MPNRRRKRGADDGEDESKRDLDLRITNILAEYHAPRPGRRPLPLLELNARVPAREEEDEEDGEAEVVSPLTAPAPALPVVVLDGRPSKRRVVAGGGGGGDEASPYQRRLWVKDRSSEWWELRSSPGYPEAEFLREFRMGRATFGMVCDALGAAVAKEDTALRAAIPVRQRVAVCVWRLATGEPLRLVSKRFGIGISTCHKLVLEVCAAIRSILMPRFLRWPDRGSAAAAAVKASFEARSGVPDVVGAMYTTHIPIIAPKVHVASYFNRRHTERNQKTSYSITLQGVVGPDGAFTDVCIGGASYPLTGWCLVPYTHQNLTWTQHAFNEKVGELRQVAVDAFSRLKSRWACLQKRTEVKLQDLPVVLGACCVLHNICEARGEAMTPELRVEVQDDLPVLDNPVRSADAAKARDKMAHNLLHRGLAGTAFF